VVVSRWDVDGMKTQAEELEYDLEVNFSALETNGCVG
jgi:hypothetical protein